MRYCALTPIPGGVVGRGYGLGYNRARTSRDQLHGGQDFVAPSGAPVYAPLPGRVVFVSANAGPRISAEQAIAGQVGQVRGMGGYGNVVVLQHDFQLPAPGLLPSGQNPPPLPSSFWTSYCHLQSVPALRPGDRVSIGQVIGRVGNTTNGQFAGMGAHLHFEVRKRPLPGSYDRDTVDPNVLWYSLGFGNPGARIEVQRTVGGAILAKAGGPSDCAPGSTELRGLSFGDAPPGFVDSTSRYPTAATPVTAPAVEPPDYAPPSEKGVALPVPRNCPGGSQMLIPGMPCVSRSQAAGGLAVAGIAAAALLGVAVWRARS
ncbi:MAG: M23 family metallopeptidase [Microbacterium sp.]